MTTLADFPGWTWAHGKFVRVTDRGLTLRVSWERDYRWEILKDDKVLYHGIVPILTEAIEAVEEKFEALS